jgi:hypothetical protein
MSDHQLRGWDHIIYTLIDNNFKGKVFTLKDLYLFEPFFQTVYPKNLHIKDKIRQVLQHLRDKGLIVFKEHGTYEMTKRLVSQTQKVVGEQELVYLLSNDAIPGWVKIGRTKAIDQRLKALYNTSIPLPFKVEETIETMNTEQSRIVETSIHSIIDTLNPSFRKDTEASRREFFKMSLEQGKSIFGLVSRIMAVNPVQEIRSSLSP